MEGQRDKRGYRSISVFKTEKKMIKRNLCLHLQPDRPINGPDKLNNIDILNLCKKNSPKEIKCLILQNRHSNGKNNW